MMKITTKQAEKVHRLVKSLCANCDENGNCILLDTAKHTAVCSLSLSTGFTATTSKKQYYPPIRNCTNKSKNTTN